MKSNRSIIAPINFTAIGEVHKFTSAGTPTQRLSVNLNIKSLEEASDTSDNSSKWARSSSFDEEDVMEAAATYQSIFTQSTAALLLGAHHMSMQRQQNGYSVQFEITL